MSQPLVTPASLALSLAPPRAPPHGSAIHGLLTGSAHWRLQHQSSNRHERDNARPARRRDASAHRLLSRVSPAPAETCPHRPHPHLPAGPGLGDRATRLLGAALPLGVQNGVRDAGKFRAIADGAVASSVPLFAVAEPRAAARFLDMTWGSGGGTPSRRRRMRYGDRDAQFVDLFLPDTFDESGRARVRGTLFFVHGGAWGSGHPWMYRLVACPFLERNFAVAVVGYRTYPDTDILGQLSDLHDAWNMLQTEWPKVVVECREEVDSRKIYRSGSSGENTDGDGWVGHIVMGHSSGAHNALLLIVDLLGKMMESGSGTGSIGIDAFVGLSGPYDINHHFDYEAGRGVEELSPMKAAAGHSRENFAACSPARRFVRSHMTGFAEQRTRRRRMSNHGSADVSEDEATARADSSATLDLMCPPILLVHGIGDTTVPFTATAECGRILRSCGLPVEEMYLEETGHQDVVMHFMLGGRARDRVLSWLFGEGVTNRHGRLSHSGGVVSNGGEKQLVVRSKL